MASPYFLCLFYTLAFQAAPVVAMEEDKTRYSRPETQSPYGPDPHGPDPHRRDPHSEVHDKDMPANNPSKYFNSNEKK